MADGSVVINTTLNNQQINQGIQDLQDRVQGVADKMKNVGETMTKSVTVPLVAMGAAGIAAASQVGSSQKQIQNSLGITKAEAEELTDAAKNIYKDGFGESMEEVSDALIKTKQNMVALEEGALEQVTKNAVNLAQTFDSDVNEVTRAGNNLMINFGITSEKAFDLMAHGAQNGLNFSQEMFDNLSEYSSLFSTMGFTAEEYFQLLEQGSKEGVYNLDYINDVMKEFQIRVKDGSKATSDAMGQMSKETQEIWKSFLQGEGTVKDVHNAVISELESMEDQVKANEIGVGLYGTKWEDLESYAMYALGGIGEGVKDAAGSMEEMNKVAEESFGQKWQAFSREALLSLEPLGKVLLDFASSVLPTITKAIETVSSAFANLSPTGQKVVVLIGAIAAAIGPFLVILGSVVGAVANLIPILSKLGPVFTVIRTAITALTGPIGIVIAIVTTLALIIYKNWDSIKEYTVEAMGQIGEFLSNAWQKTKEVVSEILTSLGAFFAAWWDTVKEVFNTQLEFVKNAISTGWNFIKNLTSTIFTTVKNTISNIWNGIKSFFSNTISSISSTVSSKFESLKNAIGEKMNSAKGKITEIWNKIKNFMKNFSLLQIGKDIIQGLINGIKSKISSVINAVKEVTSAITGRIKKILNIHSPSRWMRDMIGKNMMLGWQIGIENEKPTMLRTASEMVEWITPEPPDLSSLVPSVDAFKVDPLNMPNFGKMIADAQRYNQEMLQGGNLELELSIPLDGEVIARKTFKFTSRELFNMQRSKNRGGGRT